MVGDFDKAKLFLEALGYRSFFFYEKYRTTYTVESNGLLLENQKQASGLQICHIMLDELPFGNFVEIEGETIKAIKSIASQLGLKWKTAIPTSYHLLFENLRKVKKLKFQDLSFENFKGLGFSVADLNIQYADK